MENESYMYDGYSVENEALNATSRIGEDPRVRKETVLRRLNRGS